jgi:hypothetical protein
MIRAWTWIWCLALAVQGGRLAAEERLRDFHVLGIGINDFASNTVHQLKHCSGDVAQLADYFSRQDFDSGKPQRKPRLLLNARATKQNIERELADLPNWVGQRATAVILMASHGTRSGGNWYFVPHDCDGTTGSCVSAETIMQDVDALIAKKHCRVLMIINACHSGQIMTAADPLLEKYRDPEQGGLILLVSCVPSEICWELGSGEIFYTALTMGMRGMLAHVHPTGSVSIREIRRYLRKELQSWMTFFAWKAPGVERVEQYSLVECSLSISEDLGLTWADPHFVALAKNPAAYASAPPPPEKNVAGDPSPVVGSWLCQRKLVEKFKGLTNQAEQYVRDAKGDFVVDKMYLTLNKDGSYKVTYAYCVGREDTGEGYYSLHRSAARPNEKQLSLHYATGVDSFDVEKVAADEMLLRFPYNFTVGDQMAHQMGLNTPRMDPVFEFHRVKEEVHK